MAGDRSRNATRSGPAGKSVLRAAIAGQNSGGAATCQARKNRMNKDTDRILLISNSTLYGSGYLDHAEGEIRSFLGAVKRVLFVPYALFDRDKYAATTQQRVEKMGYELSSIHTAADPVQAVNDTDAIFIGGGNTFRLLKTLYDFELVDAIRARV